MAFHSFLFRISILFLTLFIPSLTEPIKLSENYYEKTCPKFPEIIQKMVADKQLASTTTAAATLRLFFQDCMVEGCDASILIASNSFNKAERDADINFSLPGDGFDIVTRIKTTLELECPGIVSCSDILAAATRDLIVMVGGPRFRLRFGRRDGLVSKAENVEGKLTKTTMPMSQIIGMFGARKFSVQEMVALVGAHTIGFSHCKEFSQRIFNFSKTSEFDPAYYPKFAEGLRKLCWNYTQDPSVSAFNDVMTPRKFDNMYYQNLLRGLGLLQSDQAMATDPRTKPFVEMYAANETKFFEEFSRAMEKVSVHKVKTDGEGEVRRRCDAFNSLKT